MTIKLKEEDYSAAFNILTGDIDNIDDIELRSHAQSQEKLVIKVQEYERLSPEAKEVIMIIINGPQEVFDQFLTEARRIISKKKIKKFFKSYFNSEFIANNTIKEIAKWVNQL